ncbi:hypothetical protein HYE68_008452 [Fusarium pseudograminearum]|nr:hypothetical protein HYE68_008452 [Fusarium pseudograminearum]
MLPRVKKEESEGEGVDLTLEEKKEKKRKSTGDQGGREPTKCYDCQGLGHKAHECPEREKRRQADRAQGFQLASVATNPRLDALERRVEEQEKSILALENKLKKEKKEKKQAEDKVKKLEKEVARLDETIVNIEEFLATLPAPPTTE